MAEGVQNSLEEVQYTYEWYRDFLDRLEERYDRYRSFTDPSTSEGVLIRHDVDLSAAAAVRMAEIEAEAGVSATYCFLLSSRFYNLFDREHRTNATTVASLGHNVALHFSTHEYWSSEELPDETELSMVIGREMSILREVVEKTQPVVSFHMPPEWVLDRPFKEFESTYAPEHFSDVRYVADSCQRWREHPPRPVDLEGPAQVLIHPGLWAEEDATFDDRVDQALRDACRGLRRKAEDEFLPGGGAT